MTESGRMPRLARYAPGILLAAAVAFLVAAGRLHQVDRWARGPNEAYVWIGDALRSGTIGRHIYDDKAVGDATAKMSDGRVRDIVSPSPPTVAVFTWPFGAVSPAWRAAVWSAVNVLALLVTCVLLWRALDWPTTWLPLFVVVVTLLLRSAPFAENLSRGQVYLWVLSYVAFCTYGYMKRRDAIAGAGLALALLLKVAGLPLWLLMAVERRWKILIWASASTIGVLILVAPWIGIATYERWIHDVIPAWVSAPATTLPAYQTVNGLAQRAFRYDAQFNPSPLVDAPALASSIVVIVSIALLVATFGTRSRSGPSAARLGAAAMLGVMLQPAAEQYQYVVAFVPLAIGVREWIRRPTAIGAGWLIASVALMYASLPYKDPTSWTGRHLLLAYPRLYGGVLLWSFLVARDRQNRLADGAVNISARSSVKW